MDWIGAWVSYPITHRTMKPTPERITTLHPEPDKRGVSIDAGKYYVVRSAIEAVVRANQSIGFRELIQAVKQDLGSSFSGSVSWYVTTIKLDLEARGILERVPGRGPQRLRLA